MHKLKPYFTKYFKFLLFIFTLALLYHLYNTYIVGINPYKSLYYKTPLYSARQQTKINEAKALCLQNNGLWKKKVSCAKASQIRSPQYPTLDDYECYTKYSDAGKPCTSSDKCEGNCRLNDLFIHPPLGYCEETNEPSCCTDLIEDQNKPDFGQCDY